MFAIIICALHCHNYKIENVPSVNYTFYSRKDPAMQFFFAVYKERLLNDPGQWPIGNVMVANCSNKMSTL